MQKKISKNLRNESLSFPSSKLQNWKCGLHQSLSRASSLWMWVHPNNQLPHYIWECIHSNNNIRLNHVLCERISFSNSWVMFGLFLQKHIKRVSYPHGKCNQTNEDVWAEHFQAAYSPLVRNIGAILCNIIQFMAWLRLSLIQTGCKTGL
jgi:hypothetical protein